jgi:two-component system cell cycle response regulator DivK
MKRGRTHSSRPAGGRTPARASRAKAGDAAAPAGPRVLIVDDFEDNREMYVAFLAFHGFRVDQATNGFEALERAFGEPPDVIVMDLSLPGLDGWAATRRLKEDPRTAHIPVLALTGHALDGASKAAREAGCDGYLTKPCLPERLLEEVRGVLGRIAKPRR